MLTEEDDVEIHALRARGWSITAISRHTGRDPKTIRKYLRGAGAGQHRRPGRPAVSPLRAYITVRFDDPHLDATVLFRELRDAGFERSSRRWSRAAPAVVAPGVPGVRAPPWRSRSSTRAVSRMAAAGLNALWFMGET